MSTTQQVLCRYYASGSCKRDDCTFLHDFKGKLSMVCTFYLQGLCTYGSRCRYDHVRPKKPQEHSRAVSRTKKVQAPGKVSGVSCTGNAGVQRPMMTSDSAKLATKTSALPKNTDVSERISHARPTTRTIPISNGDQSAMEQKVDVGDASTSIVPVRLSIDALTFQPNETRTSHGKLSAQPPTSATQSQGVSKPKPLSFAGAARSGVQYTPPEPSEEVRESAIDKALRDALLCPFAMAGKCAFATGKCKYMHGDVCEGCGNQCLHPHNPQQRAEHYNLCEGSERVSQMADPIDATSPQDTEVAATGDEVNGNADDSLVLLEETECGICMDTVGDKENLSDRRFGLLEGCAHCFCLHCIRTWRADNNKDNARKCPMCKQLSHFVVPSTTWPRTMRERQHIIQAYQHSLKRTRCMYYARGSNECPFGTSCFYRHENPDGTEVEVKLRHYDGEEGHQIHRDYRLWDYLAQAEAPQ